MYVYMFYVHVHGLTLYVHVHVHGLTLYVHVHGLTLCTVHVLYFNI